MKIEILGTGCPKCKKLTENVKEALVLTGQQAEIIKVTDIREIMSYSVLITPALVIDGKVKVSGKVPTVKEIKNLMGG